MPQATTRGTELWSGGEEERLPKTPPSTVDPNPGRLWQGDIHLDTHTSRSGAGEADGVAVDLEGATDSASNGAEHGLIIEVRWEARHLQPDRDDWRILFRRESDVPSGEEEGPALYEEELLQQDEEEVLLILEPEE